MSAPPIPRRSRPLIVAAIGALVVVLLAAGMYLYDHSRRDLIAKGVTIDGVSVGGMREAAARTKIQNELIARLDRPVTVRAGSKKWTLSAREAHLSVDASNMVAQAVSASREGSIVTRTVRGLFGGSVKRERPAGRQLLPPGGARPDREGARGRQPRAAQRDGCAERQWPDGGPGPGGADGRRWAARRAHRAGAERYRRSPRGRRSGSRAKPAVTTAQLAAKYPAYIIIDRALSGCASTTT